MQSELSGEHMKNTDTWSLNLDDGSRIFRDEAQAHGIVSEL